MGAYPEKEEKEKKKEKRNGHWLFVTNLMWVSGGDSSLRLPKLVITHHEPEEGFSFSV